MSIGTVPVPDLDGFLTLYGVPVCAIGEEGDLVALGHHDHRRTLAAFMAYYRRVIGDPLSLYVDDDPADVPIEAVWAELLGECGHCPDKELGTVCEQCDHVRRGDWYLTWSDEPGPGRFPIMRLNL